ncbi:MAG: phenylacetic acid degradation protein [Ponticaulis sp.]|nr:phenylacetic acid degradation protein [Ponticaulis sp.]|tara:strand:+ start:22372 stop:22806 length:435 start_codon:yes stop_codon:yes gene_type:complete
MSDFDPKTFFTIDSPAAPEAAKHLGFELLDADVDRGWLRVKFTPRKEFLNPMGNVQGGFLIAMLDETMGPAVVVKSKGQYVSSSIDIATHFIRPVKLGTISTEAEVIRMGRSVAFMEGKLFDEKDRLCATASTSAMLTKFHVPE